MQLTNQQVDHFERDGYVVVESLFEESDLQPVIDEICQVIDERSREYVVEGKLSRTYEGESFEQRLASISRETDSLALSLWNGALNGRAIFDLIRHPHLLDIAEQFCGPEIIASAVYRLRPKLPSYAYGAVPWHQDSGYTEPFCDNSLMVTAWIPLVDSNEENGCLWVLPGVHHREVFPHRASTSHRYLEIPDEELPAGQPVCVPVKRGGVLLLTNRTPHVSYENRTDKVRWSMDLRYQSASLPTNATITRLPGEIVSNPEKGIPTACYPPEADFLVRSKSRPHEVVTDPERFREIRERHLQQPVTHRWS